MLKRAVPWTLLVVGLALGCPATPADDCTPERCPASEVCLKDDVGRVHCMAPTNPLGQRPCTRDEDCNPRDRCTVQGPSDGGVTGRCVYAGRDGGR